MTDTLNVQFRVDLDQTFLPEIGKFLDSAGLINCKYYVSFEKGIKSGKAHCQGWVTFDGKINTYQKKCATWARVRGLDNKKKQYCFGVIRDQPTYCAYIMNNTEKGYIDHVTNIDALSLQELKASLPNFVDKEEYKREGKKQGYDFTKDIIQGYNDLLAERCERGDTKPVADPMVDVLDYTVRFFGSNSKVHDDLVIRRFTYLILGKFYPAAHYQSLFNKVLKSMKEY